MADNADANAELDELCWAPDDLLTPFPVPDEPLFFDGVGPLHLLGDASVDVPDVDFERYLAPITAAVNNCPAPVPATTPPRRTVTGKRAFADDVPTRPKRPKSCIIMRTPAASDLKLSLTPPPAAAVPRYEQVQEQENAPEPMVDVGDEPLPLAYEGLPNPITDDLAARIGRICNAASSPPAVVAPAPAPAPARRRRSSLRRKGHSTSLPDVGAALVAVRRAAKGYQSSLRSPAPAPAHIPVVSAPQGAVAKSVYRQTALVARMRKPGGGGLRHACAPRKKHELTRFDAPIASPAAAKHLAPANAPSPLQCYMQSS